MLLIEHILSLIAPHTCVGCKKEGAVICKECIQKLPPAPVGCIFCGSQDAQQNICSGCSAQKGLDGVFVFTTYEGSAKKLVHASKFERASAGLKRIAEIMAGLPLPQGVVTYLPTANQRVRQRGYDHAKRIARSVARLKRQSFLTLVLRTNNERQAGASALARAAHVRDVFRVAGSVNLENQAIIAIDDVITTGSSMSAAAKVLKQAGAAKVYGAAFAWTPPKSF